MKQRTFYVVNLDRGRIAMMAFVLLGFVLIAFATGLRYGRAAAPASQAGLGDASAPLGQQGISGQALENKAPGIADQADLGVSKREIPRSPEELDGLVGKSLGTEAGRQGSAEKLRLPERRVTTDLNTERHSSTETDRRAAAREQRRRERRERRARIAREKRTRDASHREERKTKRKSTTDHAPRTVMRNTGHTAKVDKEAPAAPTVAKGTPAESKDRYILQMGTYRYPTAATRQANLLTKQGFPARVSKRGRMYRVFVGNAMDRDEVARLRAALRQRKHAPMTVRVKEKP